MKKPFRISINKDLTVSCEPAPQRGKEAQELQVFSDFAKSPEFWACIQSIRPNEVRADHLEILSHSQGDDPPDITIILQNGAIGIEITDHSEIASSILKVAGQLEGWGSLPSPADAKNHRQVAEFMHRPPSHVRPNFTNLDDELRVQEDYLTRVITQKDVPGNDILLLGNALMGQWPEDIPICRAAQKVRPRHIKRMVLVSQQRCILVV